MNRRRVHLAMTLLLAAALAAGCAQAAPPEAPAEEKVLNLFAWSEYVPQALLDGFTEETGIQVNYDAFSSNEEMYAKISAGASGYDLIQPSDYWIGVMSREGLLEELDLTKIPNLANVDPAYAGKIVLLDAQRQVIGMALLALGYSPNTTDPAELEEAKQLLLQLVPGVRVFDSDTPSTQILTGEADIGLIWNGGGAIAHAENPAIDFIYPQEGTIFWYDNLAMLKGAAHPEAAHAFMDYVLRPEVSLLITAEFPYSNPNAAALALLRSEDPEAYEAYMGFPAMNPPPEALANAFVLEDVGETTALWDEIWTEIKTAAGAG